MFCGEIDGVWFVPDATRPDALETLLEAIGGAAEVALGVEVKKALEPCSGGSSTFDK